MRSLLVLLAAASLVHANGLEAVAVRPDGKQVAVGGQNRVVYLLDAGTLAVQRRLWLGARIAHLTYSADGRRLAVLDDADVLRLIDLEKGKELARVGELAVLATLGERVLVRDTTVLSRGVLRLYSLAHLREEARLELPYRPSACAFTAGGKRLLILSTSLEGPEKRVSATDVPRELTGLAREEFRQRHDGLEALLQEREWPGGKVLKERRLWYTSDSDSTLLVRSGGVTRVYNRSNVCARIGGDGAITLFRTPLFLNQGLGVSPDGKRLVGGGSGEGFWGAVEGGKGVRFSVDPLPGQAEYFNRFAVRDDGSAWGVTSAFRLVKIGPEGKVDKVAAVY